MADIDKTYLDLQGLTTYDDKIKEYIEEHGGPIPTYENETLIFSSSSNDNDNNQP